MNIKHNVSETGSVPGFRWGDGDTYSVPSRGGVFRLTWERKKETFSETLYILADRMPDDGSPKRNNSEDCLSTLDSFHC
jgi:hypothetical protein